MNSKKQVIIFFFFRIDEGDNESNQDIRNSSKISNVSTSVGKKRKRKHEEVETSQEENISVQGVLTGTFLGLIWGRI